MIQTHPQYRKLGGWLMFINVITIIGIVTGGLSLIGSISNLAAYSSYSGLASNTLYSIWGNSFGVLLYNVIVNAVHLVLNILVLVFLHRRRLGPFRVVFLAGYGLSLLQSLGATLYYAFGPVKQWVTYYFESLIDEFYYGSSSYTYPDEATLRVTAQMLEAMILAVLIITLVCSILLFVAWLLYLVRSRRVKVYFDPHYVDPPGWHNGQPIPLAAYGAAYPPAYGYGTGYPPPAGQPYPQPGYPPPTQPYAPPAQPTWPPAGPAAYPAPPPAAAPHQEPPAQQQARQHPPQP